MDCDFQKLSDDEMRALIELTVTGEGSGGAIDSVKKILESLGSRDCCFLLFQQGSALAGDESLLLQETLETCVLYCNNLPSRCILKILESFPKGGLGSDVRQRSLDSGPAPVDATGFRIESVQREPVLVTKVLSSALSGWDHVAPWVCENLRVLKAMYTASQKPRTAAVTAVTNIVSHSDDSVTATIVATTRAASSSSSSSTSEDDGWPDEEENVEVEILPRAQYKQMSRFKYMEDLRLGLREASTNTVTLQQEAEVPKEQQARKRENESLALKAFTKLSRL
ncbi:hypothetical protein BGZ83_004709 [Gryganskiella cystojenkinii]|nr:hypothetical protein BGZ83_004709 [Gryganskiella cystojenkinii]